MSLGRILASLALFVAASAIPSFAQVSWTSYSPASLSDGIWCVTYADSTFAAVTDKGNLLTSADGMSWSSQAVDPGVWLVSIAYGNGTWVVVGDTGTILVSTDLKAWVKATSPTANKLNGVLYDGTIWVAVGEAGTIITSVDAQTWALQPAIPGVTGFLHGIVNSPGKSFQFGGGIWICGQGGTIIDAVPNSAGSVSYTFSLAGSGRGNPAPLTQNLEVIVANPLFTNGGMPFVGAGQGVLFSCGISGGLDEIGPEFNASSSVTPNVDFRGLVYGNGYWVAAGEQGTIMISTDGFDWSQAVSGNSSSALLSAAYSPTLQRLVVTGTGGTILVSNAAPPSITTQPTTQSVNLNGSVTFTVSAGGTPPLTYQWFFDGNPIAKATSPSLTLSDIQNSNTGTYTVVVANGVNVETSDSATLTVLDIPVITGVPEAASGSIGLSFGLGLSISNSPTSVSVSGLPPGLVFDPATDVVSGVPTAKGVYSIEVTASNGFGAAVPADLSLTIGPTPLVFTPLAGGQVGSSDGTGSAAEFNSPNGLVIDGQGNLYVADTGNSTIRKVSPTGVVTTLAGTAGQTGSQDGQGAAARFSSPTGLALDGSGNIYVTDTGNGTIRKIAPGGTTSTIAGTPGTTGSSDGTGAGASFNGPTGIAANSSGDLYVADSKNDTIRKITSAGVVTTLAGLALQAGHVDAFGIGARFSDPTGITLDAAGNIFVNDTGNFALREVTPSGSVSTFAILPPAYGVYPAYAQGVNYEGVTTDSLGNVYVTQGPAGSYVGHGISVDETDLFQISPSGVMDTLQEWQYMVSSIGPTTQFAFVTGVARDDVGNVYILINSVLEKSSIASGPYITAQPQSQTAVSGETVTFSVTASGNPAPLYQWQFNGTDIPGATSPTLTVSEVGTAHAGQYSVTVFNLYTQVTSGAAVLSVTPLSARLINISCLAHAGTGGNEVIAGFVVGGADVSGTQSVLVRGAGPALGLAPFNVAGVLPDPQLTLTNVSESPNALVTTDSGWKGSPAIASAASAVGAFSWGSKATADSAVLASLAPGNYTAEISGATSDTGVTLVEVYDATSSGSITQTTPRLTNLSARVQVGVGLNVVYAGFVIGGTGNETVLIRASGPALAQAPFNLAGTLPDPKLTLTNVGVSPNTVLATNTAWGGSTAIATAAASVGAFPWIASSNDSAILVTLPPGNYTAGVQGASGDTGIALVEIYEVP